MNIEKLQKEFDGRGEMKGYHFLQLHSSKTAYIYTVTDKHSIMYEVIKIRTTPKWKDFDNKILSETEFKEVYPKSKAFGTYGWTYKKIDDAIKKFSTI